MKLSELIKALTELQEKAEGDPPVEMILGGHCAPVGRVGIMLGSDTGGYEYNGRYYEAKIFVTTKEW